MPIRAPATSQAVTAVMTGPLVKLPPGDWCIFFDWLVPANFGSSGVSSGGTLFALGAESDTCTYDNNTLCFTGHDFSQITNVTSNKSMVLTGVDSAGNQIGNINAGNNLGMGGAQKMLTPACIRQMDGNQRTYFIEKSGARVSVWSASQGVDPYVVARSRRNLVWRGFSAGVPLTLFSLLTATKTAGFAHPGRTFEMGRFGILMRAMTRLEKLAHVNGAEPVAALGMSAVAGDLYWPLSNTTAIANGTTLADTVQGALLTAVATTWQAPTAVTPTVLAAVARVHCPEAAYVYSQWDKTGATGLQVRGSFTLLDQTAVADVQLRVVDDTTPATVIADWQTVATNLGGYVTAGVGARTSGDWSGVFLGLPWAKAKYRWEVRLVISGVNQPSTVLLKHFCVGLGVVLSGQSIMKQSLGITAINTGGGADATYHTVFMPSPCSTTDGDQNYKAYLNNSEETSGFGMNQLANTIMALGNCPVVTACPAKSGASLDAYARFDDSIENLEWAVDAMAKTGAAVLIWNQGNSVTPTMGGDRFDSLELLYQKLVAGIGRPFKFGVMPVGDDINAAQSPQTVTSNRQRDAAWVRYARALGRDVFWVGTIPDCDLEDGTHPRPSIAGAGRIAARIGQSVVAQFDKTVRSGRGPTIAACLWNGDKTITVKVQHNGGAALKSVGYVNGIHSQTATYPDGVGPINNGATLTGWEVSNTLTRSSGRLSNRVTVSNAAITGPAEITLTLATKPTAPPYVAYLEGKPGWDLTLSSTAIDNLVFDDRVSQVSNTLGFPLELTPEPVPCWPQLLPVVAGVAMAKFGAPVPLVAGWGVHPLGKLVAPIR